MQVKILSIAIISVLILLECALITAPLLDAEDVNLSVSNDSNDTFTFSSSRTGIWDMSDGTVFYGSSITHTFHNDGIKKVTFINSDGKKYYAATYVTNSTAAEKTVNFDCKVNDMTLTLTGPESSTSAVYNWYVRTIPDYRQIAVGTGQKCDIEIPAIGEYIVTITMTTASGAATFSQIINVTTDELDNNSNNDDGNTILIISIAVLASLILAFIVWRFVL